MLRQSFLAAVLAVAMPMAVHASDLSADQIAAEIVDHSIVWWETDGWHRGGLRLDGDGTAEVTVDAPVVAGDLGRWWIEGDRLCTSWGALRAATAKCYTVRRGDGGRYITSGGNVFEIRDAGV
jgi:hypothetical protein